jgi:hypothetical protein
VAVIMLRWCWGPDRQTGGVELVLFCFVGARREPHTVAHAG